MMSADDTADVLPNDEGWLTFNECKRLAVGKSRRTVRKLTSRFPDRFRRDNRRPKDRRGPRGSEYHYLGFPPKVIVAFERSGLLAAQSLACGDPAGSLQAAQGGELFAYVRQQLMQEPELATETLRSRCIALFGEALQFGRAAMIPMPGLDEFQAVAREIRLVLAGKQQSGHVRRAPKDRPRNLTVEQIAALVGYQRVKAAFPGATEVRLDLTRPPSRRLLIKMPAPSRTLSNQVLND